ncbi:hypothetical protein GCM10017668_49350 [Streptomyces tuirus]|uniref:Pyridoxamine 5'-phosphate oxidase putative domain-containing protein n=1 Tax=Streptomyces tuirus TaxID=68278 RepID=A0A7G1NL91_9ACTN|nr:hypothetical protein GCM10017668_49350 [Streptomyces tuirus]
MKIVCRPGCGRGEGGAGSGDHGPGKAVTPVNGKLNGHMCGRLLAAVGPDGAPQVSRVWADIEEQYVVVDTSLGRVKEENLRRNPA